MSFLVTREAPDFRATAVWPDETLDDAFTLSSLRGQYVFLVFYPLDFTFVCPTEILAFDDRLEDFASRDCQVIGISVDSAYTHLAWRRAPADQGGIGPVGFPLVSDLSRQISRDYGILYDEKYALRGQFLLDRDGVVRHALVNDEPLGRNVDEAIRVLDALRFFDEYGEACPARWTVGTTAASPSVDNTVDLLSKYAEP